MVIRMRHTRAHTANRRSHHALVAPTLVKCANCSEYKLPHRACMKCGMYRGRQIIDVVAQAKHRQDRAQKKIESR